MRTLQLSTASLPEQAAPCPVRQPGSWHEHEARRHRSHLPAEATAPGVLVTARLAWHLHWVQWHEQQAEAHRG